MSAEPSLVMVQLPYLVLTKGRSFDRHANKFKEGDTDMIIHIYFYHLIWNNWIHSLNWLIDWQSVPTRMSNCDSIWMRSKRDCTERLQTFPSNDQSKPKMYIMRITNWLGQGTPEAVEADRVEGNAERESWLALWFWEDANSSVWIPKWIALEAMKSSMNTNVNERFDTNLIQEQFFSGYTNCDMVSPTLKCVTHFSAWRHLKR